MWVRPGNQPLRLSASLSGSLEDDIYRSSSAAT